MKILDIKTARLHIRHIKKSDLSDFYIYRSSPEVTKYQGFDVMTMVQAEEFIKEKATMSFGNA